MGLLGGIAAWPVLELAVFYQAQFGSYLLFSLAAGAAFGAVFGAFSGSVDGIIAANPRSIGLGALVGSAMGAIGGAVGFLLGQLVLLALGELFLRSLAEFETIGLPISRGLGWAIMGMFVASAEGVRRRSWLKIGIGVAGGIIGGLIGGAVIELLPRVLPESLARPVGLALFGALIALFYGFVERRLSAGTLRLLNGLYRGKEFIINQRAVSIGGEPGADVYLSGYSRVRPRHARLQERKGELYLLPEDGAQLVKVNDDPVPPEGSNILKFEDVLQVGNAKFLFRPLALLVGIVLTGLFVPATASAQSARIGQIESGELLTRQQVDLYVSVIDRDGQPLDALAEEDFSVFESDDGQSYTELEIVDFAPRVAENEGVTFYLLVDNSGSMYDRIDGTPAQEFSETRMAVATAAIRSFLNQFDNPNDRVGLATFNTNYTVLSPPTESVRSIAALLDQIEEPERVNAYTELYRAVSFAAQDLEETPGRTVIIVLSDGENYPFAVHSGESHPEFGEEPYPIDQTVETLQRQGASAYVINFATLGDQEFLRIATQNGGLVFNADDRQALQDVYGEIRERTLTEYRITYRASMAPTEQRYVRVRVGTRPAARATRQYYAGTLFGLPGEEIGPILLLPVGIALLLAAVLMLLRFRNTRTGASVEVLNARGRATQVIDLSSPRTIIGGSADADVTIANAPDIRDSHAAIERDERTGAYTIVSEIPVTVNNKETRRRKLSPGDVVQLPGATVIFDEPEDDAHKDKS
jgi:Mg-chelatase subunit ChlD